MTQYFGPTPGLAIKNISVRSRYLRLEILQTWLKVSPASPLLMFKRRAAESILHCHSLVSRTDHVVTWDSWREIFPLRHYQRPKMWSMCNGSKIIIGTFDRIIWQYKTITYSLLIHGHFSILHQTDRSKEVYMPWIALKLVFEHPSFAY